jgi:DNA invertase Pin-like site-specific DNA recombinase
MSTCGFTTRESEQVSKLVAYYRVSTQKQGASGLGLEAQQECVNSYARGTGGEIVASYREIETGKRCTKRSRPELHRAMRHAKAIGGVLVIAKLDRLARNVHFVSGLMESGVEFVACDLPDANRLTIHIMAAMAEHEARLISERTKAALAARRARGLPIGNVANLVAHGAVGRERSGAIMRAEAREATRDMALWFAELRRYGSSYRVIAKRANEAGRLTREGRAWEGTQVRRVLMRDAQASTSMTT